MKQKLMFFVFLVLMLGMFTSVWADVVIGTGTTTTTNLPITTYYGYSYTQQIYTAAQIGSAITIQGLKFYFSSGSTTNSNNWTIYMGHTSKTDFTSTTDWIPLSQMTQVFSGNLVMPATAGWWEVTLGSQFAYDGTSNLVIAIDENTPSYASSDAYWYSFASGANTAIYYRSDYTNPDPNIPPTATGRLGNLNQITFVTPGTLPPNPAVNPTPGNAAIDISNYPTLSWQSGGGGPTAYDVYFGTANPPVTVVSTLQPGTTYIPGALTYGQTYYWKVDPHNDNGYASSQAELPVWSFTV
nr:hypothetical protein [Candidatus Cloacimonadota bacterium]